MMLSLGARHLRLSSRKLSTTADPIQNLFVSKIREFKAANKGLDEAHQKTLKEEMLRLKRVFRVEDENKLTQLEYKFSNEHDVNLHDIDSSKELRAKIHSGEYQKQLVAIPEPESALLASIPEQVTHDLHLPPMNKPDPELLNSMLGVMHPTQMGEAKPDYEFIGEKVTPHRIERDFMVRFGDNMPTIHDDKAPERDVVNFPRIQQPLDTPPTRFHFIPESWFQFFYPKTGVTGPFAFATTFGAYLFSKEWIVVEHEFLTVLSTPIIFTYAVIKFGPKLSAWLRSELKEYYDGWDQWQQGNIATLNQVKEHYQSQLNKASAIEELYEARKQDIDLQLEHEHRNRIKSVYEDTKRRLNYLVAVADSQRQINHSNMVNWVISNVLSSIGPKQENEVLDNCIVNLKQLSGTKTL